MGSKGALEEPDEGVGVLYHQMWNGKRMKDTKKKKKEVSFANHREEDWPLPNAVLISRSIKLPPQGSRNLGV